MTTIGPAGTNVPPQDYGGVSQEQGEDFAVSYATTSSNASGMQSSKGEHTSEHSRDTSKSLPFVLATRPPINLGRPTGKQGAPLYDTQGKGTKAGSETGGIRENATKPVRVADNDQPNTRTRTTGIGAGGTGHGSGGTSGSGGTGGTSGTGGHGTGGPARCPSG